MANVWWDGTNVSPDKAWMARKSVCILEHHIWWSRIISNKCAKWNCTLSEENVYLVISIDKSSLMSTSFEHHSVLLTQTVHWLCPSADALIHRQFIDCTVGGAGHTTAILENHPHNHLICIDRDSVAVKVAASRLSSYGDRVEIKQGARSSLIKFS